MNNGVALPNHTHYFSGTEGFVYPNTADNAVMLCEYFLRDITPNNLRGKMPGIFAIQQPVTSVFAHKQKLGGVLGYPGREFLVLNTGQSATMFDTTGPWE